MNKILERTRQYFTDEEILLDLSTEELAERSFYKVSADSYARGELAALIWVADSRSLNLKGLELIKWRMNTLMDYLDGKLKYESLVPIENFTD